jgi:hypothetical protein
MGFCAAWHALQTIPLKRMAGTTVGGPIISGAITPPGTDQTQHTQPHISDSQRTTMARPRTPLAKAKATGQILHNPARFKGRNEPESTGPLGPPPAWLKKTAAEAWEAFDDELPWLNRSQRCIVAIASIARADLAAGVADTKMLNLLRQCLGQLGATPSDASKIAVPEDKVENPADKYFA